MSSTMARWSHPTTLSTRASIKLFISSQKHSQAVQFTNNYSPFLTSEKRYLRENMIASGHQTIVCCSDSAVMSQAETEDEEEEDKDDDFDDGLKSPGIIGSGPPVRRRRSRYSFLYLGEKKGITKEMRFVAMKLHNSGKPKKSKKGGKSSGSGEESKNESLDENDELASEEEEGKEKMRGEGR